MSTLMGAEQITKINGERDFYGKNAETGGWDRYFIVVWWCILKNSPPSLWSPFVLGLSSTHYDKKLGKYLEIEMYQNFQFTFIR